MANSKISTKAPRLRSRATWRRGAAQVAAWISDERLGWVLAIGFVAAHAVLWTAALTMVKGTQDLHFDVAEAYAWGQEWLLGYGKHPPLSGWIAGLWFRLFAPTDWAAYGLAMATVGVGMLICWRIALRVVDPRRAFLTLVMLALYPIFNFKGYKYNADLVQLVTLPLLVLAYLEAFEKRTARAGLLLGIAAALAVLTKYWVVTMIGAIGLAALLHPARQGFLRSPAPWVAIVALLAGLAPHLYWLKQVDFAPFTYAGDTYTIQDQSFVVRLVWGYIGHNLALLALPLALAAAALGLPPGWWRLLMRDPRAFFGLCWSRGPNPAVRLSPALNVWIIQAVVAVGPPLGALAVHIYLKTDWGISLFFLTPLCMVAIPALRVRWMAVVRLLVIWLALSLLVVGLAPRIAGWSMQYAANGMPVLGMKAQLAQELTQMWLRRFPTHPWRVIVAPTEISAPITFYSPEHPRMLTPLQPWGAGLTSVDEAKSAGFIGVCEDGDLPSRLQICQDWMKQHGDGVEHSVLTTRRFLDGKAGEPIRWHIYLSAPGR